MIAFTRPSSRSSLPQRCSWTQLHAPGAISQLRSRSPRGTCRWPWTDWLNSRVHHPTSDRTSRPRVGRPVCLRQCPSREDLGPRPDVGTTESDTCPVSPQAFAAMVSLLLFLGADAWVYVDAKRFSLEGNPVRMRIGTVVVDRPEVWAAACIILFVLFFPAYLVSRKN